jgi:hypothetical protein
VHLLAELAENATSFSSAETPVTVSGHLLSSGGVLLDITDQGVGMGAEEMAHANWRLDNPPVVDVAVSRRMGLFVVARLAARHGIRVRLRPAASGGLTALVWLPDEVVSRDGASPSGLSPDTDAAGVALPGTVGFDPASQGAGRTVDERAATAQEVSAARAPRFASLEPGGAENGSALGPRRVPGSGPRPGVGTGSWAATSTGPIPAFPASPQGADSLSGPGRPGSADPADSGQWQAIREPDPATADSGQWGAIREPDPAAADTGQWGAIRDSAAADTGQWPTAREPDGAGAGAGGTSTSGLPKRQVDRTDTVGTGPFGSTSSTDMFSGGWGTGPADAFGSSPAPAQPASASGAAAPPVEPLAEPDRTAAGSGPLPVFNAPVTAPAGTGAPANGLSWAPGQPGLGSDEVVIPPADLTTEYRLPIFEAVESDWFRRGRSSVGWAPPETGDESAPQPAGVSASSWSSPADQGWQAAAAAAEPSAGGVTTAGLPKRVPRANLVPGTAAVEPAAAPGPARSASATRDRFASFQRGTREGRAAAGTGSSGGEDGSSP